MGPEFVQRVAPELALRGRFTESQAGLAGPENMYDSRGNPLNWMQNEGGVRQFYVPEGEQMFATPPAPAPAAAPMPLRNRIPEELPPNAGLTRSGVTPPDVSGAYSPNRQRFNMNTSNGNPQVITPLPPRISRRFDTMNGPVEGAPTDLMRRSPPRQERINSPLGRDVPYSRDQLEERIMQGVGTGNMQRPLNAPGDFMRSAQGEETLGSLLDRLRFNVPQLRVNRAGTGEAAASTPRNLPEVDVNIDGPFRNRLNFRNTGPAALAEYPDLSTDEGAADFSRRLSAVTGRRLTFNRDVRTPAEQARLNSSTDRSFHMHGRGIDFNRRHIGNLTGERAVQAVASMLEQAGYPPMELRWESGEGEGQGTGPHVHGEPTGRYDDYFQ